MLYTFNKFSQISQMFSELLRNMFCILEKINGNNAVNTSSSPPVIFIAGRPKAALLFWFFGDFRCGALLFMVIHVIYKYKNK